MSSVVYSLLQILAMIGIFLIGAGVAYRMGQWLSRALLMMIEDAINELSRLLILATVKVAGHLKSAARTALVLVWEALETAALLAAGPTISGVQKSIVSSREYLKLLRLYVKHGREEFASFAEFRESITGDEEPDEGQRERADSQEKAADPRDDYERALEILGFGVNDRFSLDDLKKRYREMLNAVHPDKGFQNTYFSQQINEAVTIIKRRRKWK